jgi:hypothetical protein
VAFRDSSSGAALKNELIYGHSAVLSKSTYLLSLLTQALKSAMANGASSLFHIKLDLSVISDAMDSFKSVLSYLYTGEVRITQKNAQNLAVLSQLFGLPSLELLVNCQMVAYSNLLAAMLGNLRANQQLPLLELPKTDSETFTGSVTNDSSPILSLPSPPQMMAFLPLPKSPLSDVSSEELSGRSSTNSAECTSRPNGVPSFSKSELIVPSNDKEGWCRNKKYIETVKGGFRCTVCNKVYGRYNSVSYHVTIYHRNPPIQCDEPGCNFTTREARYIHFHKYYKHQVPLPGNIDLDSRKCRFPSCRHVSKSPAMLEKHLTRHLTVKLRSDEILPTLKGQMSGKA